ncbi:glycosyltransferase [Novosphingobium huizhouense]|uniref:glycosyltransferase n=1 Tax=Novosphingobium huizhouense TaxID=2866625 RepID=UPI001CD83B68|nr:glycosyltransferase [Novosphingobium huizhouense]
MTGLLAGLRIGLLTAWASRAGGGVFEAVALQAEMIRAAGGEAPIFALDRGHVAEDTGRFAPGSLFLCRQQGPAAIGFAGEMVERLVEADLHVLHLHGIWMYPSSAGAAWARRTGRPYIVSPHGMLDPWITARGRWKKALARAGYERRSWRASTFLHALTQREAEDIARESGRTDSVVIPNPGPEPAGKAVLAMPAATVAYIGRIHPKKNLLPLVAAWKVARLPADARLVIAGWGAQSDIEALQAAIGDDPTISFVGPVFGKAKDALIAGARFVVLPSLSEGLPMAILEAWSAAVPTIMTSQCNLPEGFAANASLQCGFDAPDIGRALERALQLGEGEWVIMAAAAQALFAERFSPARVAATWARTYASVAVP